MDSIAFPTQSFEGDSPRERTLIVMVVVALHMAVLFIWMARLPGAPVPVHEMEITVSTVVTPQPEAAPVPPPPEPVPVPRLRKVVPEPEPAPVEPAVQPSEAPVEQPGVPAPAVAAAPVIAPSAPVIPDAEPDYRASYLNNPPPPYPFAARRMGLQGKVVLNVEVLAEGLCGQINVHRSSGHEILDNAALQTVKTWKFIPAHQAGRAITKWFKIPIQFSLSNNET